MKRILICLVVSLLLISCGDGIKEEAVGMFLLPGINYGDDIDKLVANGIILNDTLHFDDHNEYCVETQLYGVNLKMGTENLCFLSTIDNKVTEVRLSGREYGYADEDSIPPFVQMAMSLENELTSKFGTPIIIQKLHDLWQTPGKEVQWEKDGIIYTLSLYPGPLYKSIEIHYEAKASKNDE